MDIMSLGAVLSLKTNAFETAMAKAESRFSKFGGVLKKGLSVATKTVAAGAAAAGAAATAFVASSVKEGAAFDKAMSQVAATMGRTTDSMTEMSAFARKMGQTTAFSATEAAEALNYMALAGYDDQKSMAMLPKVLDLAAAGSMGLAQASDMVTDASSALGLSMEQTETLVDQMAKTSSKSNTSVAQLGEAILSVGGTAKIMHGGTTELNAALGILADNGIKGSEGGRALRNVLLGLSAPTDKAAKQLKKLGVEVFDSTGNMRELPNILQDMNEAMDGMTDEQKTNILSDIFNKNDMKSINALLGTTTDRWAELVGEIVDSKDAAKQMAETQLDNLPGDITKFKSALSEAKITISEALMPTLREFVQAGTTLVTDLTNGFKEGGLKGAIEAAQESLSTIINDWKESDNPLLNTAANIAEKLSEAVTFATSLATDWENTIGKMKTSGSPFGVAFALGLEFVKTTIETVIGLINDWPETVAKLKESNNLGLMLLGGALDVVKGALDWIVKNEEAVTTAIGAIAAAFLAIKIDKGVTGFIAALKTGTIAKFLFGSNVANNVPSVPTAPTTPTGNGGLFGLIGNAIGAAKQSASLFAAGGGMATVGPIAALLGLGAAGKAMIDANLNDEKLNQVYGQNGGEGDIIDMLTNLQAQRIAEYFKNYTENAGTEEAFDSRDKLQQAFEESGVELSEQAVSLIENIFDNYLNEVDPDGLVAKLMENHPDIFGGGEGGKSGIEVPLDPKMHQGAKEYLQGVVDSYGITLPLTPTLGGFGFNWNKRAKGGDIPYDNYPALLHRGERVLTASQNRKRESEGNLSNALVDAIQGLKQDFENMKLVVGKRTFGRTMVDYGGSRMENFIGASENRFLAGYGE